jgi:hypothetical protein
LEQADRSARSTRGLCSFHGATGWTFSIIDLYSTTSLRRLGDEPEGFMDKTHWTRFFSLEVLPLLMTELDTARSGAAQIDGGAIG